MYLGDVIEQNESVNLFSNPKHPYTKALLCALPSKRGVKLENIKGQISPITTIIEGCKFHPRCNCVMEICKKNKPDFIDTVACHLCK